MIFVATKNSENFAQTLVFTGLVGILQLSIIITRKKKGAYFYPKKKVFDAIIPYPTCSANADSDRPDRMKHKKAFGSCWETKALR